MNASNAARAIVITSLIALTAAAAPPQVRTGPQSVLANPSRPQRDVQPPPPPPDQYTTLSFTVTTGDDDLRSDSKATATIFYTDNTSDVCVLRTTDGETWDNNKTYDAPPCVLRAPRTFDQLKAARVELSYAGAGSADPFNFHSYDNWDVDEVRIEAENTQHVQRCLIDVSKRPYLVRMTAQQKTFVLSAAPSTC